MTRFVQLNLGWNADPNAPGPEIDVDGSDLMLSFRMNSFEFERFRESDVGVIRFSECVQYRLGLTNDEGWYHGQCRFSKLAPAWGELYEVSGDLRLSEVRERWTAIGPEQPGLRHFLFYFRDETFECDAMDWSLRVPNAEREGRWP